MVGALVGTRTCLEESSLTGALQQEVPEVADQKQTRRRTKSASGTGTIALSNPVGSRAFSFRILLFSSFVREGDKEMLTQN